MISCSALSLLYRVTRYEHAELPDDLPHEDEAPTAAAQIRPTIPPARAA